MYFEKHNPSAISIYRSIVNDRTGVTRDKTYIILGTPGPTGKTWLCTALRDKGFNAFEISECICGLVDYNSTENHVIEHLYNQVVIVLNRRLK